MRNAKCRMGKCEFPVFMRARRICYEYLRDDDIDFIAGGNLLDISCQ